MRTSHQDQAVSINSSQSNPNAFFKQSEINNFEHQQNYLAAKTRSCSKPIELPADSKEKINQVIEPIADLLLKENFHGNVNAATYKDYLNFVEKLLTLPSQTNPQNEYELAYLKNGIFELYFSQNGDLKFATPTGYPSEQLSDQIGIYLQNSLQPHENQTAVRYLDGMKTLNFKTIGYKEKVNEKLTDSHPRLGIFSTKSTVKNHALEFGKKIENNSANKELLGFVKLIKDEAFNGNKESERKVLDFLAKNPNNQRNKLAHKIYNERYAYKPSFCKYDPKIAQISTAEAVQRHKNVQSLIAKLNLDKEKVNVFLIKSFYEITDKDAPKNSLDVLLNLKINGNENLIDKIAQEESIHKNEPAVKNALEYLRLAALTRHNPENFNVRFLSFGINEALKNPNSDQTILHCNNFLDYPNKLNDAQIANKNIIVNLAADACKKIYSEPNTNNLAPVKQLKLANYLHNLNQDTGNAKELSDTIQMLSDSLLNGKSVNNPELASLHNNIVNNALQIAEVSFNNPVNKSVDLNVLTKPAFGFNNAALSAVDKADKLSENSKPTATPTTLVESQIKVLTNVARNSLVIARNLLNVAEMICDRSIRVVGEFAENPSDILKGVAQGAVKGVGDTLESFDIRNLSVFYRLYSAAVTIKDVVSNLSLDEHEWLEKNKPVLKYLDELAEQISNSSTQDFFKQASSICVKIAIAPQIYKLAKKSINFTSDRIIGKTPEGFEFSTNASQKGGGKSEKVAKPNFKSEATHQKNPNPGSQKKPIKETLLNPNSPANKIFRSVPIEPGGPIKKFDWRENTINHLFSKDHIKRGILNFGKNQEEIIANIEKIILDVNKLKDSFVPKSNEIHAIINGHKARIRVFLDSEGSVLNINILGVDKTDRILGKLIQYN